MLSRTELSYASDNAALATTRAGLVTDSCVLATSHVLVAAGYDEDQSRAIFLAADTDGSGLIELQEFLIWFKAEAAKLREGGQAHGIVLALQRESSGCDDGAFIRDQIRAAEGLASPRLMRHVPGSSPRPARMRSRIPNFSKLRSAGSSLPANLARMPTAGLAGQNSSFSTPGSSLSNMRARASAYGSGVF